ncbi:putative transcriptional regulator, TetR family [Rhodococcus sp. AW25M09]|uniref:TetR/AcrR family transcriptional regulator n=1 Tax=Rhodococcus sp. AW25M09 TaxID=1268303 RepID=UPI0002ABC8ED|nr:TetR family transcriptional regulator [Rhodococcus sp. AW25M09]CCQ15927.1 putative transcriptional regulator, TetR family [Rhodococcus sp. AW25M09]
MSSDDTRDAILAAAERLFAERGVFAVSNRQVSEWAGQRNSSAVGYHFGTKEDLVLAIVEKHAGPIEERRIRVLAEVEESTDLRDWVSCLVIPYTEHLAAIGVSSSYARFSAQAMADPVLRGLIYETALESPALRTTLDGLRRCVGDLPESVRTTRSDMARQLIVHMSAERERHDPSGWTDFGSDLVDAIVGLWSAPVSR